MSLQQVLNLDENLPKRHEETVRLFGRLDTANYSRANAISELPANGYHNSISKYKISGIRDTTLTRNDH